MADAHRPDASPRAGNDPVLLIGGSGMLGRALRAELARAGIPFIAPPRAELDLSRAATISKAFDGRSFSCVINAAAWTDVDGAESNEQAAMQLNAIGVGSLAEHCRTAGVPLVHYSTDYVFDGVSDSPYRVDEPRAPVSAYGRTKAHGEVLIEASGCDYLIIRTSWLYAPWGKNFVRTIAKAARERPELKVVNDQRGRPTSSEHLATLTLGLLAAGARGIHHGTDGGECTWFEFASEIVRLTGAPATVRPCTSAEFPRPAKRPAFSVLDLSGTERILGPMPDWRTHLAHVIARLEPLS